MLFTTDKQTLEDLNIFGKHGGNSIYNIFNRCITRGGAAILDEMFQYPLSDEKAINARSGIIRHFAATGTLFPFENTLFDAIEPYLANTDERTRLTADEQSVVKKINHLIAQDAGTVQIRKGITAIAGMLNGLRDFIHSPAVREMTFYQSEIAAVNSLLNAPALAPAMQQEGKIKLSSAAMPVLDSIFRFRDRDIIFKLLRHVYYLDVYLSVARVARERGFVFPLALPRDRHTATLEGVYHPQVPNAVSNTIRITPQGNVIFLTGANMAGKSTFMKSLSIALFLAHMGFPVAAKKMEFSVLDGIYTTINLPDNLGMGASHFYAEVLRVKKIAHELSEGKNLLVVFDEMFRGTNVKDAYEATIAITKAFATKRNSLFVISTHIIEAGDILKTACNNVHFIYLPTKMDGNKPVYTYKLENGITDDRHGMIIINNEGILDMLQEGIEKAH
ncbi:MutS-related protein [Chitinophaga arvensicola]|uniref:MutS domain III n=1 Tax=Chitinophaga arvensicola TaxID=29529 RepID=A0A1I0RUC2_9BACT|nr:DNA mismatch repair protein [Chitinophaga arvensicola]SEW44930.1 MutS domain III [Chitinophaga arvensicola]